MDHKFLICKESIVNDKLLGVDCCCKALHLKYVAQKMKFFIKDFFSKCDKIRSFLRIWSHLLKKSLIENFIFCAMTFVMRLFSVVFCRYDCPGVL